MAKRVHRAGACLLLAGWLLLPPAQAQDGAPPVSETRQRLLELLQEDLDARMQASPTWASARGDRRFDDALPDVSAEARSAYRAAAQARLARLKALDVSALSENERVHADLLAHELEQGEEWERFLTWQMPLTQLWGPQQSLPQLPDSLSFTSDAQLLSYVKRLEAVGAYLDQTIANMREGLAAERTPPRLVLAKAADQASSHCTEAHAADPTSHPMYAPFKKGDVDGALAARAKKAILAGVIPAFRRLAAFLREEYTPGCRESTACSAAKDGEAYYALQIRHYTTTDMSADAIHALGLEEVARIRGEMFETIARSDFSRKESLEGDALFAAFTSYLREDPRFYHPSAEALLAGYRAIAKRIDAELPRLFGTLPRLTYGVKEMPAFMAPTAPTAYYYSGSLENGVPGWFVANTHKLDQRPRYEMVPLTLHEAVPGHHLQNAIAQEMQDVPEWRTILSYTAYGEGWALYAERLGLEMGDGERGFYQDPYDDFGRSSYEMWRATRLVVDTGLHAKGWSRQQAIEFMLRNSALTQENVDREVDRYIAWPGQALAYKLGELRIRALRARAEERLGDKFDLRSFHDTILGQGQVPLDVLERIVERWIASVKR